METNGTIPQRRFGKSDVKVVKVSVLGLDGHHLGSAKNENTAVEIVHRAFDGDITVLRQLLGVQPGQIGRLARQRPQGDS